MKCSRHGIVSVVGRERGAEMIDVGNDSSVVGRERGGREEAKMIDPVGGREQRRRTPSVCAPWRLNCSRIMERRPR